jgi:hypothetical protein
MRTQKLFVAATVCLLGVGLMNVGAQGPKKPEPPQPPEEPKLFKPKPVPPMPMRWEYRILSSTQIHVIGENNLEAGFNKLGAESWELAGIEPPADKFKTAVYIFRRPAAGKSKAETKPQPEPAPKQKTEERLEFHVYRLKHANAVEVAAVIDQLMRTGKQDPWRIVAEPHSNQLLLRGPLDIQIAIELILQRIDVPSEADAPQPPMPPGPKKGKGPPRSPSSFNK